MSIDGSGPASSADALRSALEDLSTSSIEPMKIEVALHSLLVTGGDTTLRDYPPRLKNADEATSRKELNRVADAAEALYAALGALHAPASAAIRSVDQQMTASRLLGLVARAAAEGRIEPRPTAEHLSPKAMLAHAAACVFVDFTGRRPTRVTKQAAINESVTGAKAGGDFVKFLEKVFSARGIVGGVESCAKTAIKAMEFHQPK